MYRFSANSRATISSTAIFLSQQSRQYFSSPRGSDTSLAPHSAHRDFTTALRDIWSQSSIREPWRITARQEGRKAGEQEFKDEGGKARMTKARRPAFLPSCQGPRQSVFAPGCPASTTIDPSVRAGKSGTVTLSRILKSARKVDGV